MKPGDRVVFHVLTRHACGGTSCACVPDLHCEATVVEALSEDELVLDVHFKRDQVIGKTTITDRHGSKVQTVVTKDGYVGRQSRVTRATSTPAESGSWSRRS